LGYFDFVHKELVQFSYAHVQRSIPSVVDGLKPGQRKVLFACFKRKLASEIKVAQLAGYVAEHTAYHHGEASLHGVYIYSRTHATHIYMYICIIVNCVG
jgi:DNA topoisomerase II